MYTYDYRGNGTRHSRTQGSDTTYYHYAAGFGVTNEENGTDVRTYIGGAHFDGSSSSLGTASYYTTDHLGSTRGLYDGSENAIGQREYTPYGVPMHDELGSDVTRGYTGHHTDPLTGNHFAPFRYYNPQSARWLKRDPLGMINGPNMYGYVGGNPVNYYDPYGLEVGDWWDLRANLSYMHYNRNTFNIMLANEQHAIAAWRRLSPAQSIYHQIGPGNRNNRKYVSPDGRDEAVFDECGNLVTDPTNLGTYNYGDPVNEPVWHFILDVIPYWYAGNGPGDTTSRYYRTIGILLESRD